MKTDLDFERVAKVLIEKTAEYITKNNLRCMILGFSGGIDSTVVGCIGHEVSKLTGIPLIGRGLPLKNKTDEISASRRAGEAFSDDWKELWIQDSYVLDLCQIIRGENGEMCNPRTPIADLERKAEEIGQTKIANGNLQARERMKYLYNLAGINGGIVLDTDNRTEHELGFFTVHGDQGDFSPMMQLWKTEVYELAKYFLEYYKTQENNSQKIQALEESIALIPTDGNGVSSSDLEQIGGKSYSDVDDILYSVIDLGKEPSSLYSQYTAEVVDKIMERHHGSWFKRSGIISIPRYFYDSRADINSQARRVYQIEADLERINRNLGTLIAKLKEEGADQSILNSLEKGSGYINDASFPLNDAASKLLK